MSSYCDLFTQGHWEGGSVVGSDSGAVRVIMVKGYRLVPILSKGKVSWVTFLFFMDNPMLSYGDRTLEWTVT